MPVDGDTVGLANGRVLQVENARIQNGRAGFRSYGVEGTMSADFVRQIRRDDGRYPGSVPLTIKIQHPDGNPEQQPTPWVVDRQPPIARPVPEPESFYLNPTDRAYWQEKMAWLREQILTLEAEQVGARRRPESRSGNSPARLTASRRELQAWLALESALRAEALRLGVPSDWLWLDNRLSD